MHSQRSVHKDIKLGKIRIPSRSKHGTAKIAHKPEKTELLVNATSMTSTTFKSSIVLKPKLND